MARDDYSRYAFILWLFTFLFLLRVLAQALVAYFHVPYLPPMEAWYDPRLPTGTSGLIPYPILFPIQILILILQAKISRDFSRRGGFFVVPKKKMGQLLRGFSILYFLGMALRYIVTMALFPERRWLGNTVPIFFHFVLAGFLFALGHFHTRAGARNAS